jgi:hypothetical protein
MRTILVKANWEGWAGRAALLSPADQGRLLASLLRTARKVTRGPRPAEVEGELVAFLAFIRFVADSCPEVDKEACPGGCDKDCPAKMHSEIVKIVEKIV